MSAGLLSQRQDETEEEAESAKKDAASQEGSSTPAVALMDAPTSGSANGSKDDVEDVTVAQYQIEETWKKVEVDDDLNRKVVNRTITDQVRALNLTGDTPDRGADEKSLSTKTGKLRSPSPSGSSSAEDVVVFTGRSKAAQASKELEATNSTTEAQYEPQQHKKSERPAMSNHTSSNSVRSNGVKHSSRPFEVHAPHDTISGLFAQSVIGATSSSEDVSSKAKNIINPSRNKKTERMSYAELVAENQVSDEDEALVKDYLENMREFTDSDVEEMSQTQAAKATRTHPVSVVEIDEEELDEWDSADLEDLENLSTSDECPEKVARVLSSRDRPTGLQYLVVGVDELVDEARWITQEVLSTRDAIDALRDFEARQDALLAQIEEEGSDDDSDDDSVSEDSEEAAFNDYMDNLESERDENDKVSRRRARMTDEEIALALAKQEELGMDADEVLLFNGAIDDDEDDDGILEALAASHKSHRSKKSAKKKGRASGHFPSASAFADALDQDPYGAYDIMDFDRPGLKPKKKGRKSALPFEVEDEELRLILEQSWENDRKKKAEKKKEREALRAQGLLGSKNGKADLHLKYRNGMTMANIRFEIKEFFKSSHESISLTTMESFQRRQVHLIAHALQLKSKSHGSGAGRYPVLFKTKFTPIFDLDFSESELDEILASSVNPNQIYRTARKSGKGAFAKAKSAKPKANRGGGGKISGATYADGEVVGATAPEIGIENKGRAMLEKMGWSKGMGLGALTNKGMLTPIEHVVKNSKAGLG